MPSPEKRSHEDDDTKTSELAFLEVELSEHLAKPVPERTSNFHAMCAELAGSGLMSVRCGKCGGRGHLVVTPEQLARAKARIKAAEAALADVTDPRDYEQRFRLEGEIAKLRKAAVDGAECPVCHGIGFTERRSSVQRSLCDACDGHGTTADGEQCGRCFGTGGVNLGHPDSMWSTVRCWRCAGSGEVLNEDRQDVCPLCGGEASTVPVTVRETGCTKKGKLPPGAGSGAGDDERPATAAQLAVAEAEAGVAAHGWEDDDELVEFVRVERFLDGIRTGHPREAAALESYHGDEGARWAKDPRRYGRGFSVAHLTEAGEQLLADVLERSYAGARHLMRPLEVLAAEREAEFRAKTPTIRRRALLTAMDRQIRELVADAHAVLAEVAAG